MELQQEQTVGSRNRPQRRLSWAYLLKKKKRCSDESDRRYCGYVHSDGGDYAAETGAAAVCGVLHCSGVVWDVGWRGDAGRSRNPSAGPVGMRKGLKLRGWRRILLCPR